MVIVIYMTLSDDGRNIRICRASCEDGIEYLLGRCLTVLMNVSIVLIFISVLDYAWNKYVMEEKMKMTKQEVKDEHKEYE